MSTSGQPMTGGHHHEERQHQKPSARRKSRWPVMNGNLFFGSYRQYAIRTLIPVPLTGNQPAQVPGLKAPSAPQTRRRRIAVTSTGMTRKRRRPPTARWGAARTANASATDRAVIRDRCSRRHSSGHLPQKTGRAVLPGSPAAGRSKAPDILASSARIHGGKSALGGSDQFLLALRHSGSS